MHFTIRILEACPELGLEPGDLVTYEPELGIPHRHFYVHRSVPADLGPSLLPMLESRAAEMLNPDRTISEFAGAVGWPAAPPRTRGHLALLE